MGRVRVFGTDPQVGSGYGKTRPEPEPLPFLSGGERTTQYLIKGLLKTQSCLESIEVI